MTPTKRSVAVTLLWRVCVPDSFTGQKSVRIRSYSGPYSVRMRENTDQDNSEHGHFSRSDSQKLLLLQNYQNIKKWLFWVYYKRLIVFYLKDLCCFFQNINYLISFFVIY